MSITQDSSSNKSESSQLTAEGWCRSRLVTRCEFDFESCNVMGNRAIIVFLINRVKGFILTKIYRILFSTFSPQCHGFGRRVKRLPCTLPDLKYFSISLEKATFVENQPELLVPLEARSDPRTLRREIVSTETHSVPHPCTWGSNQSEQGEIVQNQVICLHICKTYSPTTFCNFNIQVQSVSSPDS